MTDAYVSTKVWAYQSGSDLLRHSDRIVVTYKFLGGADLLHVKIDKPLVYAFSLRGLESDATPRLKPRLTIGVTGRAWSRGRLKFMLEGHAEPGTPANNAGGPH
jgi:hypothetical protein